MLDHYVEIGAAAVEPEVDGAHVGIGADSVGDDAPVGDPGDQRLHFRVIEAHDGKAVERDVLDEAHEGVAQRVEGAVMVEMLGIDVGHHRDGRGQAQERAVRFVGLHHHPVAFAQPRVGAVGVDDAAIDDGRIEPAGVEHGGDHRRRRGLAVRAADRDRPFEPHQLAQHLGATHHRQLAGPRRQHLGIVLLDRTRHDHDLGAGDIVGAVADRDLDAELGQPSRVGAVGDVAALHLVAEIVQHLGDAGHADAADADEMDQSDIERQRPHAATPDGERTRPVISPTRSARRAAASGRPAA